MQLPSRLCKHNNCTQQRGSQTLWRTKSYSGSVEPRATPGQLHRELLPVNCTESYPRSATPRATPGLLQRELLPDVTVSVQQILATGSAEKNVECTQHHPRKPIIGPAGKPQYKMTIHMHQHVDAMQEANAMQLAHLPTLVLPR